MKRRDMRGPEICRGRREERARGTALLFFAAPALFVAASLLFPHAAEAQTRNEGKTGSLDLASYISLVERNSLQLEVAATERSIAVSQEKMARSQLYPTIAGELGYTRNVLDVKQPMPVYAVATPESPTTGIYPIETQDIDINANNDVTAGISLRQKLFDMNVFRGLEASSQYTDLTATTYDAVRQGTVTGAKRLFYQTLLLKEVLEVREISEEIAYENYLDAKRRLDNGVASPLEALQAEVSWKLTEPNTSQARRNLNVAMENLRNLAGLPEDREIVLEGSLERLPELPEFLPAEDIRGRRPDYRLLLNEEALRKINISVERSKFYPSISASVNYGLQTSDDGFDFDLNDATDTLTAGITVSIPVFYGGSRFASLEKARLELQRTRSQMAQKESDISTELENIQLTLEEAKLRVDTARQTLETAEKAYEVSRTSVENGLATQLELKDARVSLEQARLGYLTAGFDYLSAYFDWQMATGRGAEVPSAAGR